MDRFQFLWVVSRAFARSTEVPRNLIPLETHTAILIMVIMGQKLRIYRRIGPECWIE